MFYKKCKRKVTLKSIKLIKTPSRKGIIEIQNYNTLQSWDDFRSGKLTDLNTSRKWV